MNRYTRFVLEDERIRRELSDWVFALLSVFVLFAAMWVVFA